MHAFIPEFAEAFAPLADLPVSEQRWKWISTEAKAFEARDKRYHNNEQECLAVIWTTRKYRPYLEDTRFKLRTDSSKN